AINSNGVSLVNGDSTLVSGLLCTPHSSARNQETSSSHALAFNEGEMPRSSALSLNVPLREEEAEPIIQLPAQAGNGQNELIKNAPPSTSTANSHDQDEESEPDGEIDIQDLSYLLNERPGLQVLLKQKRNPLCYVKVYSSGKIYIVAKRNASALLEVWPVWYKRVWASKRTLFEYEIIMAQKYPENSDYEPELSVGLVWRSVDPKATLRIHTTGSITVTGGPFLPLVS
uniref:Uncharacterized protein n=1 Tax=Parascaris equorum TaxID=6256 RepID=A0A914S260_PAREQ